MYKNSDICLALKTKLCFLLISLLIYTAPCLVNRVKNNLSRIFVIFVEIYVRCQKLLSFRDPSIP
jgi:hypothetical protein